MPGRSVTSVSGCPFMTPSLRSTVTPGKLPTCWFIPVSWLKRVVLPQFWLPTRANVRSVPSGRGFPVPLGWKRPSSPRPGWGVPSRGAALPGFSAGFSSGSTLVPSSGATKMCSASARRRVSSYPYICISMGSPMGANLTTVTDVPGISPISSRCWRNTPEPFTAVTTPLSPMARSRNVLFMTLIIIYKRLHANTQNAVFIPVSLS